MRFLNSLVVLSAALTAVSAFRPESFVERDIYARDIAHNDFYARDASPYAYDSVVDIYQRDAEPEEYWADMLYRRELLPRSSSHGTVKWYNAAKGFGYIDSNGQQVFLHVSALEAAGIHSVHEGQSLYFTIARGAKGATASNIMLG